MNPRGEKPEEKHAEEYPAVGGQAEPAPVSETPASEGQGEGLIKPILDRQLSEQKGGDLELQNLESKIVADQERTVGVDMGIGGDRTVISIHHAQTKHIHSTLQEVMECPECAKADSQAENDPLMKALEESGLAVRPDGTVEVTTVVPDLIGIAPICGEQPDGSYNLIANIPEGYINAVREWAAAEDKTAEEWINGLILANIESWAQPARGR